MKKKLGYIPLEHFFASPDFAHDYNNLMREDPCYSPPGLREAMTSELIRCAGEYVRGKRRHEKVSAKGGYKKSEQIKEEKNQRNARIAEAAKGLIAGGRERHTLAGILAPRFGLSTRQIRDILKAVVL